MDAGPSTSSCASPRPHPRLRVFPPLGARWRLPFVMDRNLGVEFEAVPPKLSSNSVSTTESITKRD